MASLYTGDKTFTGLFYPELLWIRAGMGLVPKQKQCTLRIWFSKKEGDGLIQGGGGQRERTGIARSD